MLRIVITHDKVYNKSSLDNTSTKRSLFVSYRRTKFSNDNKRITSTLFRGRTLAGRTAKLDHLANDQKRWVQETFFVILKFFVRVSINYTATA